ncbi:hypothetical protein ACEVFU_05910 [Lacticaseibacillus paracasei]|jgi:hypothetical protein|uniref:hypothetical protein n=1 Tax=Lacticaseibacillus paracasei TaxID=1597 RepID=UPI000FF0D3B6|nr:hypothetical protein [Lacticaseibacillus paracasei]MBF4176000.1 hypothetical protein [Lacticaseibacillus paracasei subsp. tolerans]MBZ3797799.1 hypothetical protein [Lacticaseibacillus paracasei]MCH4001017.1 hypothetical protein [Lacticaseibacillus paracasei]MCH4042471.1 hypothetical protein [Lacticaseibacillus paracasei]MCH4117831.1 hypothetical protein [Lacticaseibacillus paracasei]
MQESNRTVSSGTGFCGLLTIAFIVLKLCHVIDWPWLWVVSPILIGFTLTLGIFCILLLVYGVIALCERKSGRKQ